MGHENRGGWCCHPRVGSNVRLGQKEWAYLDCRQNHLRDAVGGSVSLARPSVQEVSCDGARELKNLAILQEVYVP